MASPRHSIAFSDPRFPNIRSVSVLGHSNFHIPADRVASGTSDCLPSATARERSGKTHRITPVARVNDDAINPFRVSAVQPELLCPGTGTLRALRHRALASSSRVDFDAFA